MNEDKKLGQVYAISGFELEASPLNPSRLIREREARMIGWMAEEAHLMGRRFVEWPTITLTTGSIERPSYGVQLRAEVTARKAY